MATSVYNLNNVTSQQVASAKLLLKDAIGSYTGDYDLDRGVIHDVVLELSAFLAAAVENNIDKVNNYSSLQYLVDNPELATTDTVDKILSNFQITRISGVAATGKLVIIMSEARPVTIGSNAVFTINNIRYVSTNTFNARTNSNQVLLNTDRLITRIGTSNYYYFVIDVACTLTGTVGNVPGSVEATMTPPTPSKFVKAYTYGAFVGGTDAETNTQLIARLLEGWAVKSWGSRTSISALLRTRYPNLSSTSIIGAGDSEMLRDKHGLFPISTGGKTDVYCRYSTGYSVRTETLEATLYNAGTKTWQINIGRDVVPGFYDVQKVVALSGLPTDTGFAPTVDLRSFDLAGAAYVPDIANALEAVFSPYQTGTIRFIDPNTSNTLSNGAKQNYYVIFRYMPNVGVIQTFLSNVNRRPLSSDVLVKAPIPVFCSLALTVNIPPSNTVVNTERILQAISEAVHSQTFSNTLSSSLIYSAIRNVYSTATVPSLTFSGILHKPNGTKVTLTPGSTLTVANDYANMVSSKTVVFFLNSTDITMTVTRT